MTTRALELSISGLWFRLTFWEYKLLVAHMLLQVWKNKLQIKHEIPCFVYYLNVDSESIVIISAVM